MAKVEIVSSEKSNGNTYLVKANLTIKETTLPVEFIANVTAADNRLKTVAEIKVNRAKYGIKYKSKTFFPELGDKFIHDEFVLKIDLDLPKQNS